MTQGPDLWADWVTIWQSEMAGIAADREVQEMLQRGIELWAARAMTLMPKAEVGGEAGSTRAVPPPGSTPVVAAPGEQCRTDGAVGTD